MSMPTIPGYEVTELVGRGGMGRVYRATDRTLGRTVAVKMLVDADDPELLSRFESEAIAVASLAHPNITRLFEFCRTETGLPFCVMEYVSGGTLADRIAGRPMRSRLAAEIIVTLARAIHVAHQEGILHRDLKPGNILVAAKSIPDVGPAEIGSTQDVLRPGAIETQPGRRVAGRLTPEITDRVRAESLRITDFGLARKIAVESHVTRTGQIVGTPAYMAPEQASGMVTKPGPGVDIYSLGAILFELLTGRPPFVGADGIETIMLLLGEDPVRPRSLQPTIPRDLETICLKCLEKKPSRRYVTAEELAADVARYLDGRPILAKPTSRLEHLLKWGRRNPWKATAGMLFTCSGTAAVIGAAALQTAYSKVRAANSELSTANTNLKQVNAEILETRDLAKDALDGIVDRLRDELHDVPKATQIMMDTSRDSLALHRRMHTLQPDDHEQSRMYVSALYSHVLLEWLHGSREQSSVTFDELQVALDEQIRKHPDDVALRITQLKLLLDRHSYAKEADAAVVLQDFQTVDRGLDELLVRHPDDAEVLKLAGMAVKEKMDLAMSAGDYTGYVALAKERVEFSRRFAKVVADFGQTESAALWLSQSQYDLANGLLNVGDPDAADRVIQEAQTSVAQLKTDPASRMLIHEQARLLFAKSRIHEARMEPKLAVNSYAAALSLYVRLVQDFPDDVSYRTEMASALIRSAALSFSEGNSDVALEQLTTAESQVQEALKLKPGHSDANYMKEAIPRYREQMRSALEEAMQNSAEPITDGTDTPAINSM